MPNQAKWTAEEIREKIRLFAQQIEYETLRSANLPEALAESEQARDTIFYRSVAASDQGSADRRTAEAKSLCLAEQYELTRVKTDIDLRRQDLAALRGVLQALQSLEVSQRELPAQGHLASMF